MLKGHKVLHEEDSHFVVQGADGKAFKVAKARLAHSTVEKIRGYAEGGEVKLAGNEHGRDDDPDPAAPTPDVGPQGGEVDPATGLVMAGAPAPTSQVPGPPGASVVAPPEAPAAAPVANAQPLPKGPGFKPADAPASFDAAAKLGEQGAFDLAKAKGEEALTASHVQEDANAKRQNMADTFAKAMTAHQARSEALFNEAQAGKIDPNRYMNSRSTGQRISSAISLIIGGIGAGLSKGPNLALQTINNAIDRDMESQRADLGKKQTLLGHYMQQGREMQTAYGLAKADQLDITAGQMMSNALKFADPKSQAEAQLAVGQMRTQAAQIRQGAEQNALALQGTKVGMQYQQSVKNAIDASVGQGGSPARQLLISTFAQHPEKLAEHQFKVPEERQIGTDKSGQPRYQTVAKTMVANTPDDAKKAKEGLLSNREQDTKLRQMESFVKQHPIGAWSPADKQRIETLTKDFDLSWNKGQEGLNRVNEIELDMVNKMRSDPGGFWSSVSGKSDAAFKALRSAINSRRQGIVDTYSVE